MIFAPFIPLRSSRFSVRTGPALMLDLATVPLQV
jgi:hypothetical protein